MHIFLIISNFFSFISTNIYELINWLCIRDLYKLKNFTTAVVKSYNNNFISMSTDLNSTVFHKLTKSLCYYFFFFYCNMFSIVYLFWTNFQKYIYPLISWYVQILVEWFLTEILISYKNIFFTTLLLILMWLNFEL